MLGGEYSIVSFVRPGCTVSGLFTLGDYSPTSAEPFKLLALLYKLYEIVNEISPDNL